MPAIGGGAHGEFPNTTTPLMIERTQPPDLAPSARRDEAAEERPLPTPDEMYAAVLARDTRYDGIFFTAVKTTGIFCRPSCPARKPARENVMFCRTAAEALELGFRPCKKCRPLELPGETPEPVRRLLAEVEEDPTRRLNDDDLRARGHDPVALRRWFKKHHGMTFHAYQRSRRLAWALGELSRGARITEAGFGSGYESLSAFQDAVRQVTGRSAARSRGAVVVQISRVATPLGPMLLGATEEGVCLLEFTDRPMLETQLRRLAKLLDCVLLPGTNEHAARLEEELREYFAGRLREFTTPLVTHGSDFQRRVWNALREIPFAETRSYMGQARLIGSPGAVRAVARANGDNRIAIVIPCHRVIGADGSLTGYGGGLWRKKWLLHHEGVRGAWEGRRTDPAQTELGLGSVDGSS